MMVIKFKSERKIKGRGPAGGTSMNTVLELFIRPAAGKRPDPDIEYRKG
jgi:hypothetical protein